MTATPDGPPVRRRAAAVGTVLGVVLVVVGEFVLLTAVYHSGDGAESRYRVWTGLQGAESQWQPGEPTTGISRAAAALAGAAGGRADRVTAATRAWTADPTPARFGDLQAATTSVGQDLEDRVTGASRRAALIHGSLLALVSFGWFFWFRGVVRRQRQLQRSLTQTQVAMAGEQRLTALVRNSADLMVVIDPDTTVSFASPSTQSVLGLDPADLMGRRIDRLVVPGDAPLMTGLLAASRHGDQVVSLHACHADGRELALEGTLTNLLADEAVGGWVLTARDVTERLALRDELAHRALHDSLTGLPNRQLFTDRLSHALRRRSGIMRPLVVLFIDLDDFKHVNDSLGHGAGNDLLMRFARQVSQVIRQGDTAARLGGDEFAVLMEDSDLLTARTFADLLVEAGISHQAGGEAARDAGPAVGLSVGVALAVPGRTSAEEALRNAEVAMHFAKDRGKGRAAAYDPDLHATALRRLEVRSELSHALQAGDLVLHYQPAYQMATGRLDGFEALVRWEHPVDGLRQPHHFVEIAEQSGLIVPMGRWALQEACRAAANELMTHETRPVMAVNVSARQLVEPGFRDDVLRALADTGLDPARLVLEITETALLDNRSQGVETLEELRDLGVHVAIDDFGTGYSSLSYLADLPVEILKIDKSFVDGIGHGGEPLVEAIISLGDSLGLVTLAEGVEEPAQEAWLIGAGCRIGQGFLWAKPLPLAEARSLVLGERPAAPVAG